MWYPPGETTHFFWNTDENPFKIDKQMMIASFTHNLPSKFRGFQWTIAYPGGKNRGNLVYSKVLHPFLEGFAKQAFIVFGLLRAFPNQQIRKLCCAIKDNLLPWSHPCVRAVVRQALFQVGELSDDKTPLSEWKKDLQSSEGLSVFCSAVHRAAVQLKCSPRNFEDVPILSEVAAFLSQWTPDAHHVVSQFVEMCRRWAREVKKQYQSNLSLSAADIAELRAHEGLLYGYALQSYTLGDCDDTVLVEIGELIVLFRNSMFFPAGSKHYGALKELEIAISETMARRINSVVCCFTAPAHMNESLTNLLHLVNSSVPSGLKWSLMPPVEGQVQHTSSCFEAFDSVHETHYSMNLLNGIILADGNTPGGLPVQIKSSERYRELFGDQDFEVTFGKGVYKTAHPIGECYFHFLLENNNEFRLREVYLAKDAKIEKTLVLCDAIWLKTLKDSHALPSRVLVMHSLWYWAETQCILARPKSAFKKDVAFALKFDNHCIAKCFKVPVMDQLCEHHEIMARLGGYDSLVQVYDDLTQVLNQFEEDAFIHALRTPDGRLKISFPRFRLSFVQDPVNFELESLEFGGYVLDREQQFEDVFPNFRCYLVLRLVDATALVKPKIRILVPVGLIIKTKTGELDVDLSTAPNVELDFAVFDVHRRFETLTTESITARLQLCALLASTGSNIPSRRIKMTGSEAALHVLQGCTSSQPFSDLDLWLLVNICSFGQREPALRVLASCILEKAVKCAFLLGKPIYQLDFANALTAYSSMCVQIPERNPLRCRLTKDEETLFIGHHAVYERFKETPTLSMLESIPSPVKRDLVAVTEGLLASFLVHEVKDEATSPALPIKPFKNTKMSCEMNLALEKSWQTYHQHPDAHLTEEMSALLSRVQCLLESVTRARTQVLKYLHKCVTATRIDICSRLLEKINYLPTPTTTDFVQSSYDETVRSALISRASPSAQVAFKAAVLQFMELCVLEDKLERLVVGAKQRAPETYFVDELSSTRQWSSEEHPYWLAFEVEGRLQIRHEQYIVAQHLIENPGSVCQMNMGRGKTRVIMPMLFLYYSHRYRGKKVVRAHFLTPLLSETRQFMHRYLSASSTLGLNFIELPFHRTVKLDADSLWLMLETIEEAKRCGKFLMVAPEHRMSLELKQLDLKAGVGAGGGNQDAMVDILADILDSNHYIDILDECDAVLHHKYHLVYAVGTSQRLEHGDSRWAAVEALLYALTRRDSSKTSAIVQRPSVTFQCVEYANRLGGYSGLRLNAAVEDKGNVRRELRLALATDLIDNPPASLWWLSIAGANQDLRDRLVRAMTDPNVS